MTYERAVALIPGFFGFGRIGQTYYFADRVAATLRGAVEARVQGAPTPVMGLSTRPGGSLVERQRYLLAGLSKLDEVLDRPANYHLVGHSTGGVDAELLRADRPLDPNVRWADLDPNGVRQRLRTVTTIAAPHHGTYLAISDAVGFVQDPLRYGDGLPDAAGLALQLLKLATTRDLVRRALLSSLQPSSGVAHFMLDVLTDERILADLAPDAMAKVRHERAPMLDVPVTSFVTATSNEPVVDADGTPKCDKFFELLHGYTARVRGVAAQGMIDNLTSLEAAACPIVRNPRGELPKFDPSTNDGIVNSCSQLLRGPRDRLGGIILGDHGDVLGHYDRADPLTDGTPLNEGFFRSGADFGDDQFFALYALVASSFFTA